MQVVVDHCLCNTKYGGVIQRYGGVIQDVVMQYKIWWCNTRHGGVIQDVAVKL